MESTVHFEQLCHSSSVRQSQQRGVKRRKTMLRFRKERTCPGDEKNYKPVLLENRLCTSFILADKYFTVSQEVFFMTRLALEVAFAG